MSREPRGYRENLQDILEFSGGKRMLSMAEVKKYTGLCDYRALQRRFPFKDHYISAATLALCLSGGET